MFGQRKMLKHLSQHLSSLQCNICTTRSYSPTVSIHRYMQEFHFKFNKIKLKFNKTLEAEVGFVLVKMRWAMPSNTITETRQDHVFF